MYSPYASLDDPPAQSPLGAAIAWLEGAALGSTATIVAVIAVAAIGLLMLSGRLELRRGVTVALGCFILFGATSIGAALTGLTDTDAAPGAAPAPPPPPLPQARAAADQPRAAYDPYAGASVPVRR
jgi:type IV secretory pathway VirB2 component (pilin)